MSRAPLSINYNNKWPLSHRLNSLTSDKPVSGLTGSTLLSGTQTPKTSGRQVVAAGLGINLALGILYAYSMLAADIATLFPGSGDPYATACLSFAVSMIIGGKMQDKVGPRVIAFLGGLLVGAGFLVCSQTSSYWGWVFGFGVLAGTGIGFGYSAATPPALKWFSPAKTGLIAGIVVSGFGIAPVYLAPACQYLLGQYGLHTTMMILGVAFIVIVCTMSLLLTNPPTGFVPVTQHSPDVVGKQNCVDATPIQMLKERRFYILWLIFFVGAGAGLMVIGSVAGIAKKSMGEMAFIAVAVMAIGNAAGRVLAGLMSDKIGRATTLILLLALQSTLMFLAVRVVSDEDSGALLVTLMATFIGFNYGSNLSLFPSFIKDYWGTKNYGTNYGILFSAWGVGAFVLVKLSSILKAMHGGMESSFVLAGILLLIGTVLAMSLLPLKGTEPVYVAKEPAKL